MKENPIVVKEKGWINIVSSLNNPARWLILVMIGSAVLFVGAMALLFVLKIFWISYLVFLSGYILLGSFFTAVYAFPDLSYISKKVWIGLLPLGILVCTIPTDFVVRGISIVNRLPSPVYGPGRWISVIILGIYTTLSIGTLSYKWIKNPNIYKSSLGRILVGTGGIIIVAFIFNSLLPAFEWAEGNLVITSGAIAIAVLVIYTVALEEQVAKQAQELIQAHREEKALLAELMHSLQTPLAVLKVQLDTEENHLRRAQVNRAIDAMSKVVYETIRFGRRVGASMYKAPAINISLVVECVAEYTDTIAATKSIKLISEIEPGLMAMIEEEDLETILTNLLSNAIRHSREHGSIVIELQGIEDEVRLSVEDFGSGMNRKDVKNLFNPKIRSETVCEGMGLGLIITRRIVENAGGIINISSRPNLGTTCTVTLPRAEGENKK